MPGNLETRRGPPETPAQPLPLLPVQLMWISAAIPLFSGSLASALAGDISWDRAVRSTLALYVPFLTCTAALIAFYRRIGPAAVARVHRRSLRVLFHLGATAAISLAVGVLVFPGYLAIAPEPLRVPEWLMACLLNGWTITLPTLWIVSLTREADEKQLRLVEAKLEALHARINPHFLFNSLNTVASLIADHPDRAERVVERLADAFRHVLDTSHRLLVPLSEEIAFADDLLTIHGARFEDSLEFKVEMEPGLSQVRVPSLLMQSLVENAVLHGVSSRGRGTVKVVARRDGEDHLAVEVWDDGIGPGESPHRGTGTGLADLKQRLQLLYGGDATFSLLAENDRTCARVRMPLRRAELDENPHRR